MWLEVSVILRVRLYVTEMKSHPWMKKILFTREFHPGMKFSLKENLPLSMKTYNKISHFFSIIEIRSLICKKHQTIKSKMHKMGSFNKKKYLPVSKLSTSSILLLLLKLNLVNLYKTVNQKYYTCAWCLRPATLFKKKIWHRCFPVNFVKFLRTPILKNTSGRQLLHYAKEED